VTHRLMTARARHRCGVLADAAEVAVVEVTVATHEEHALSWCDRSHLQLRSQDRSHPRTMRPGNPVCPRESPWYERKIQSFREIEGIACAATRSGSRSGSGSGGAA
jgi:hypothetical protein